MLLFMVPLLLITSKVYSLETQPQKRSAASESQIKFAIENKYDQTGPGAQGREYAYDTYKTLDEAIVGYLDDADTKLPENEKANALQRLISSQNPQYEKSQETYLNAPGTNKNLFYHDNVNSNPNVYQEQYFNYFNKVGLDKPKPDPFRFHKIVAVKNNPVNLAHFTRDPSVEITQVNHHVHHPQYSFSYGVHDKATGDSKSAHETRAGDVVHGFYTFLDADGKQRTVQYTADDALGFRALVRRTAADKH